MSFVCSDLHKSIGGMFSIRSISEDAKIQAAVRQHLTATSNAYIQYMEDHLAGKDYLMGKDFTPADAYAFVVLGWTKSVEIPLTPYKNIQSYLARVAARPAVARVLQAEGLV
jgi:glutathione S-transferase